MKFTIVRLEERIAPGALGGFWCGNGSGKGSHKGSGKGSKKGSKKGSHKGSKKGSHKGSKKGGGCNVPPVCPPRPCW